MKQLHECLQFILENGVESSDRTGVGTISVFGQRMEFDISKKFPAITTKKLAWRSVVTELLWFLEGSSDERRLCELLYNSRDEKFSTIWTGNANDPNWLNKGKTNFIGDLGRIYGTNWRSWPDGNGGTIDQVQKLIDGIKHNPFGRRHILTGWNVADLEDAALPPCHVLAQFYVRNGVIDCQMYQRSADMFLGVPFNIASYSLLTYMIAQVCNLTPGKFIHIVGDAHIYSNHVDAVKEQLARDEYELPTLQLNSEITNIFDFKESDIHLMNYSSHPAIKAPMAV